MNTLSLFSLFPAWLAGAHQRILHNHSTAVRSEGMRSVMKTILRPFAPLFANRYAACSRLAGDWMYGKKMMASGRVTIINNAIDLDDYAFSPEIRQQYRKELNIPESAFVIGHVGRFMYQKNHAFLIEVFKEVVKRKHNAILLLIGDGELRLAIEEKVQKYHLSDKVRFLGLRKDVKDIYNCMDVFVLPSWYEGLPVVSIEAEANGVYCLFSDHVTAECKLTNYVRFLRLTDSSAVWANAVLSIKSTRNPFASEEIRKAGFDINETSKRLFEWYCEGKFYET